MSNLKKSTISLSPELEERMKAQIKPGMTRQQLFQDALKLYLMLKEEEEDVKARNPNSRVKVRAVFEVTPNEDENKNMASVLIY